MMDSTIVALLLCTRTQAGALNPNLGGYLDVRSRPKVALLTALNKRGGATVKKCYEWEEG